MDERGWFVDMKGDRPLQHKESSNRSTPHNNVEPAPSGKIRDSAVRHGHAATHY